MICCRRFSHAAETPRHAAEHSLNTDTDMSCWPLDEYFGNSSPSTDWLGVLKLDKNSTGCTPSSQPAMPSHQQPGSADQFAAQEQPTCQDPFPHDIPLGYSAPACTDETQGVETFVKVSVMFITMHVVWHVDVGEGGIRYSQCLCGCLSKQRFLEYVLKGIHFENPDRC